MHAGGKTRWLRRGSKRRGAATVEMAVVSMLLFPVLFGIMEFGWVFMVQQTLTNATREACRVRVLQGSTNADGQTRFQEAIAPIADVLTPYTLTFTETATTVTASVSVPYQNVSLFGSYLKIVRSTLNASCSMRKEGVTSS